MPPLNRLPAMLDIRKRFPQMLDEFRDTTWTGQTFELRTPERVVAALLLGMHPPRSSIRNEFGDGPNSVYPALGNAYMAAEKSGDAWKALVDAGVVDSLCQLVIHGTPFYLCSVAKEAPNAEMAQLVLSAADVRRRGCSQS